MQSGMQPQSERGSKLQALGKRSKYPTKYSILVMNQGVVPCRSRLQSCDAACRIAVLLTTQGINVI